MSEEDRTAVTNHLDLINIPYQLFRHPGRVDSLEQAAEERGQQPKQVVRSILFRLTKGEYAMVLMAGPDQISWPALRGHFGQSRLTMASRDEVLSVTGYKFGAVSPFGLPKPLRILVDASVLTQEEVSIGSGERGLTVILNTGDLMQALNNPEVGQFGKEPRS
jgi:Cys-tRNA(Pro) deacylase